MNSKNLPILLFLLSLFVISSCKKEEDNIETLQGNINLTASDEFPLGVVLEWNNIDHATSYDVYRKVPGSESFLHIEHLHQGDKQFFDEMEDSTLINQSFEYYIEANSDVREGVITSNITSGAFVPITAENSFILLAELTGGVNFNVSASDSLTSVIINIINTYAGEGADIMLMVDKTGSMADDIDSVRQGLTDILNAMPANCRLGLATYGDLMYDSVWGGFPTSDWYDFQDLTLNHSLVQNLIDSIYVTGGGELPESVFDGLHRTINNASWQSSTKLILVVGDAPPIVVPCISPLSVNMNECTMNSIMDVVTLCTSTSVGANLYPVLIGPLKNNSNN